MNKVEETTKDTKAMINETEEKKDTEETSQIEENLNLGTEVSDKKSFDKYREILVYLIVGVLTTIVSWIGAWAAGLILDSEVLWQNNVINTFSWVVGVVFAYPLNRKWVFKSTNKHVVREFLGFAGSRVSTWIMDVVIMTLFVNVWPLPPFLSNWINITPENATYWEAKILISAVVVTIANYIFSKLLIFRKKK